VITYEQLLSDKEKLAALSGYLGYELDAVGGTRRVGSSIRRKGIRNPQYGLNLIDSIQIARQVDDVAQRLHYQRPVSQGS
jgi:hypothetical protein